MVGCSVENWVKLWSYIAHWWWALKSLPTINRWPNVLKICWHCSVLITYRVGKYIADMVNGPFLFFATTLVTWRCLLFVFIYFMIFKISSYYNGCAVHIWFNILSQSKSKKLTTTVLWKQILRLRIYTFLNSWWWLTDYQKCFKLKKKL